MNNKEYSPFTPGSPVPIELFEGRSDKLKDALKYIKQSKSGKMESIFVVGSRGIGKSSFASYVRHIASKSENYFGVHVFLGQVNSLEEMVRQIFEQILNATNQKSWFSKIYDLFKKHIKELDIFGVSFSFNPSADDLSNLVAKFPEVIARILSEIGNEIEGMFLALDDINGLAEKSEFANWYKSFADSIAVSGHKFPATIMMIGLPEKRDTLHKLQPSLMRIFRIIEIEHLSDEEVSEFFIKAFKSVGIAIEAKALRFKVTYSSGLPILMHEIGDSIYYLNQDNIINENVALNGILDAAGKVGKKYLDPKFYRSVHSQNYKSIMRKLGHKQISQHFTKKQIEPELTQSEKKVFHNF